MNKILVGIDGSEKSEEALNLALNIADKMGSSIELIHVIEPVTYPSGIYPSPNVQTSPLWASSYYSEYQKESEKMLTQTYEKVKDKHSKVNVSKKIVEGLPATSIVEEAEEGDFDLIVVGAHGLGFIEELVLGSVSKLIVDKSTIPVLVVK